jgi:hypothetical protein
MSNSKPTLQETHALSFAQSFMLYPKQEAPLTIQQPAKQAFLSLTFEVPLQYFFCEVVCQPRSTFSQLLARTVVTIAKASAKTRVAIAVLSQTLLQARPPR